MISRHIQWHRHFSSAADRLPYPQYLCSSRGRGRDFPWRGELPGAFCAALSVQGPEISFECCTARLRISCCWHPVFSLFFILFSTCFSHLDLIQCRRGIAFLRLSIHDSLFDPGHRLYRILNLATTVF